MRRFEREARETAALGSTHTIDVYDFGVTEEGDFYYVMELLKGSVSSDWCRNSERWTRRGQWACCGKSATRSARLTFAVWSTATSSRRTSWSAGSVPTMTS